VAELKNRIEQARKEGARSIDGFARSEDLEEKINGACRTALTGPAGEAVMEYIKSITTSAVMPAGTSDAELREMEGMRRLTAILDMRRRSKPTKGK
jgi:hypothetical protein